MVELRLGFILTEGERGEEREKIEEKRGETII